MSKLPKVPKLRQPANKVSSEQASSEAHEMLLIFVRKHVHDIVSSLFSASRGNLLKGVSDAIAKHAEETTATIKALERNINSDQLWIIYLEKRPYKLRVRTQ